MRTFSARLGLLLAVALAACTSLQEVSPDTTVTCNATGDCPGGRVCNRGRCVNPNAIDTTPPDIAAGSVTVTPARVKRGGTVTVTLQATEPLEAAPTVALGLVPPIAMACGASSGLAYACSYTATGHENGDLGGDIAIDVRMRDLAGNDTARSSVATISFDFTPPSPTIASVGYSPAPTNPLPSVRMATAGTLVQVAVSANERLSTSTPPTLVGRLGGSTLTFALLPGLSGGTDAVFEATVPAGLPDGDYALEVTWTDEVGNTGTAAVPGAVVKVKTSRPTLTVNQPALVFVRSPWGNASPEFLGGSTIPAGAHFALEPADPLSAASSLPAGTFLLDGGVVPERVQVRAGSTVVGTLRPEAGGTWPRQPLASPDTFTVDAVGFDDAGNASDPRAIESVEWVATSNLPVTGVTPHTLLRTPLVEAPRVQRTEIGIVADAEVAGADGVATVALAEEVWRKATVAPAWRTTSRAALAYDGVRGRVVMFGGMLSSSVLQEARELVGNVWVDVTPPGLKPAARFAASLAYDGARGRVVLFGGERTSYPFTTFFQDTWEWDGTSWEEKTPGSSPPARSDAALAYDSARRRLVLFGGSGSAGVLGDTWEWDGTSWSQATPAGGSPSARSGHSLAYDHARGVSVLLGGSSDGLVWEWNGQAWSAITPAGSAPVGATGVYVHDGTRGRVVVFQHWWDGAAYRDGVWEWDGISWSQVPVAGAFPPVNGWAAAHDAARGRTVLVEGGVGTGTGATWEWDGASFRSMTPTGLTPPPRYMYENALAYDAARRRMVLFGGSSLGTWEWNGASWAEVTPAGSSPPQWSSGLAYDASSQRTMLISSTQTWAWDGTAWTSTTPATYQASGTLAHAGALVVLDGSRAYRWTGLDWTSMVGPGITGWPQWLAAFDSVRGRLVAYDPTSDTGDALWEWNGASWANLTSGGSAPSLRISAAMAFDSERGRTILFGGSLSQASAVLQDTWEWDGTRWREATPSGIKPPARRFHSLAYDSDRQRTVLFSGNDIGGDIYWDDTWELEARPGNRPAVQFDASMARTGIAPGKVTGMLVRAYAGGTFSRGDAGSTGTSGAALRGWTTHSPVTGPGVWVSLATNRAGVAAAQPVLGPPGTTLITWAAGAEVARRFITEGDGRLSFQVVPSGSMGPDPGGARVALDYIEVRVRYTTP